MQVRKQQVEPDMEELTGSKLGKEYIKAVYCHPAYLTYMQVCVCMRAKSPQSCTTLCDPMGYSPPGSSVHGILQARVLEWVAMPSSRGSSQPRNQTSIFCIGRHVLYHQCHLGTPKRGSSGPQDQCGTSVMCCWLSRLGLNLTKRIQISYCQLVCMQVYAALWGSKEDSSQGFKETA